MDPMVLTYAAYLLISVALTVWVARVLSSNGRAFLVDVFAGDEEIADSVNRLLVVGFYLINLGYVSLALKSGGDVTTLQGLSRFSRARWGWCCWCSAPCTCSTS